MGCHAYKTAWTPCIEEEKCSVMELTNLMNKYNNECLERS